MTTYVRTLLEAAGTREPEPAARQFVMLMEGAIVTALRERTPEAAHRARELATPAGTQLGPAASRRAPGERWW